MFLYQTKMYPNHWFIIVIPAAVHVSSREMFTIYGKNSEHVWKKCSDNILFLINLNWMLHPYIWYLKRYTMYMNYFTMVLGVCAIDIPIDSDRTFYMFMQCACYLEILISPDWYYNKCKIKFILNTIKFLNVCTLFIDLHLLQIPLSRRECQINSKLLADKSCNPLLIYYSSQ